MYFFIIRYSSRHVINEGVFTVRQQGIKKHKMLGDCYTLTLMSGLMLIVFYGQRKYTKMMKEGYRMLMLRCQEDGKWLVITAFT